MDEVLSSDCCPYHISFPLKQNKLFIQDIKCSYTNILMKKREEENSSPVIFYSFSQATQSNVIETKRFKMVNTKNVFLQNLIMFHPQISYS